MFKYTRYYLLILCLIVMSGSSLAEPLETGVQKQRGVSLVGGRSQVTLEDFELLAANHVNWIVQTPFGWQDMYDSPTFRIARDRGVMWGERDVGIETTTRFAKQNGIRTLLKPHIWLRNRRDGKWRGHISMKSEQDWRSWFECYKTFILHYASLAEKNDIAALSIGTELHQTALLREQDWRKIIVEIRKVYSGKLTYSANWYQEYEDVKFWDALDFIGIQGYFPLTDQEHPQVELLREGWRPHKAKLREFSKRYGKKIVFTEIGYKSRADAAVTPWEWPGRSSGTASEADLSTQANCYEAFFQTFWTEEWCAGAYFWKWFPSQRRELNRLRQDFTPQNKPAEKVMASWYGGLNQ